MKYLLLLLLLISCTSPTSYNDVFDGTWQDNYRSNKYIIQTGNDWFIFDGTTYYGEFSNNRFEGENETSNYRMHILATLDAELVIYVDGWIKITNKKEFISEWYFCSKL